VAVAGLLWVLGVQVLAVVVVVAALAVGVLGVVWPAFGRAFGRVLHTVSHSVGAALTFVLIGAIGLLVITPVALLLRVVRRDPLVSAGGAGRGWHDRGAQVQSLPERTYTQERDHPDTGRRTAWRFVQVLVTSVVLLALLDLAAGMTWDRTLGNPDSGPAGSGPLVDTSARADLPAMEDAPWAEEYFLELDTMRARFDPFLLNIAAAHDGPLITTTREQTRVSYEPAGLPEDAPVVWFFGGSTMFGEGQRDEHTIPSEVARLAEDAGRSVRVVNFGQRGWVIWQEVLQLERQLAVLEPPDLVVFYDGTNDINVLAEQGGNRPTVYNADDYRTTVAGGVVESTAPPVPDVGLWRRTFEWWRERSLAAEVAGQAEELSAGAPALAGEEQPEGVALTGEDRSAALPTAVDIYQRGRAMALELAEDHDLGDPVFFWQPELESVDAQSPSRRGAVLAGEPTIDISTVLADPDSEPVFIDGGHTNELGARIVAEAMWGYLAPLVEDLHQGGVDG
jgi:lysophospholipase L1-like esterase